MNVSTSIRHSDPMQVKGWCPGAIRPMAARDGLVVRIRPPAGWLSPTQAHGVAVLAGRWAQPVLELTNRANLQLRGVNPADHAPLLQGMRALGLVDADVAQEARRNVQVQPFWTDGDITPALARALGNQLASKEAPALPAKFGFVVDTGPVPCLRDAHADIRMESHPDGVLIYADGADHGVLRSPQTAVQTALALARWFLHSGGAPAGRGRMSALLRQRPLPVEWRQTPVARDWMGAPAPGPQAAGYLVGFPFGLLRASTLATLGTLGALRLTPWRALLVEGAKELPAIPEMISDPNDVRLRVAACTGAPGCEQAQGLTRPLALELAPLVPPGKRLHVSGCPKGCAHPKAAVTVVTTASSLNLVRWGTADSFPDHSGLDPSSLKQQLQQVFSNAAQL